MCGDGKIDYLKYEKCDDGNTAVDDGCSDRCEVENGWTCVGEPSVCTKGTDMNKCGDGVV